MVCFIDAFFGLGGGTAIAYHLEVSIIDGSPRPYEKWGVYSIYSLTPISLHPQAIRREQINIGRTHRKKWAGCSHCLAARPD